MKITEGIQAASQPSTPTLHCTTLPDKAQVPRMDSVTSSMQAENISSPPTSTGSDMLPSLSLSQGQRTKYTSPPPSSSMTPPPSSQVPQRVASTPSPTPIRRQSSVVRTPTPFASLLSSPPPTTITKTCVNVPASAAPYIEPTASQISNASPSELQSLLQVSTTEIARLTALVQESRMAAAHFKLQHNLLSIETEEAAKLMEVEHEMTRREVEFLQSSESPHARSQPLQGTNLNFVPKQQYQSLEAENHVLRRRLRRAKKLILEKEEEASWLGEENRRLLNRIKENRDHLNRFRRPGGLYGTISSRPSSSITATSQNRGTSRNAPGHVRPTQVSHSNCVGEQNTFAAILLADQMLSQESTTAPSTPARPRPSKGGHFGHSRNVQSLSSLPSTPARSHPPGNTLTSSIQFPATEPRYRISQEHSRQLPASSQERYRRRRSRDSTISASDNEDDHDRSYVREVSEEEKDDEVEQSQASQLATHMLRRSPGEKLEVIATPAEGASGILQAKLFGQIKKPGMGNKRKRGDVDLGLGGGSAKRANSSEGVGLGIGSWTNSRV